MAAGRDSSCHPNVALAWLWVQLVQGACGPSMCVGRKGVYQALQEEIWAHSGRPGPAENPESETQG